MAWQELAKTAGYGTVHFSPATSRTLREVSERIWRSRRINHRFGEGASPRLRQIREAVHALGIDPDSVLNHATPRIFYGCELHPGAREELMGLYPATESKGAPAGVIASLWRQRWLANRIRNPDVLAQVAGANAQSLVNFFAEAAQGKGADDEASTDLVIGEAG